MAENYISTNMNTGVDVKTALERIEAYQPDLFVWTEISDSVTVNLKSPTTYSGIKDPGDYVIYKFSNGPSAIPSTLSPILLSLRNGVICVTANNMVFKYDSNSGTWKDINEDVEDSTVIYIKDNAAPTRTKNTFWFDTSKFDGTKNGYIDLKYYNETTKSWESVFDSAAYLKKSKLDPDNKQLDIFDYIDDKVADAVGDYGDFMKHVDNKLTLIHVSAEDRANYAKIITAAELQNLINTTYKTAVKSAIDTSVNTELDTSTLEKNVSSLESDFSNHLKNHVTAAQITAWSNKAEANHTHDYTTGTTKISASQIVGGTFAADKLPDEIKERYYAGSGKVTDLSTTTVGSTFKFGKYQVESETPWAIEWEIVHQTDEYQIAQTKQIIDLRCFDAKESTNTNSDRKDYGNNNWQYSNIKQFLNSDKESWYSAQHQYDAPPNSSNCYQYSNGTTYNAYDTHKGFLYYFSDEEKSLLKDMTLTLANNTVTDGGGSYTWTGKVWLPTYTQMSGNQNNNISEGTKFDKYSDDNSRIKTLHENCAKYNEYCKVNSYTSGTTWSYWMSSALPSYSYNTRGVNSDGGPGYLDYAYDGYGGLAPCICLPRTGTLTSTPSPEEEFSNTSITDTDRATKYHNGNAFYYPTTDAYGNLTYRWFRIIDSTKVGTADWASGVTEFTATESVLDWNSISGRPTTLEGFGITETLYTKSQVDEKFSTSKEKATELSTKTAEMDGDAEYDFEATTDASISNIGFQIRTSSSTYSDMKTGSIPQIDAIIKTADNRIYKSTQNLNSTYTDANGTTTTTTNAAEPLGASMTEVYNPGENYYSSRFAADYSTMEDNPNYTSSGCGISVTATAEDQTLSIKDPNDNTKELCKMVYSNKHVKFVYPKYDMVDNVVKVGIGSTEKLNILNSNYTKLLDMIDNSDRFKYVVRVNIEGCDFTTSGGKYGVDVDVNTVSV